MKRDGILGRAVLVFGIAVLVYVVAYNAIERRRDAKGPWQVTFAQPEGSPASITINQPALGITNVQILLVASTNAPDEGGEPSSSKTSLREPVTLTFRQARKTPFDVPFGKCVFLDTVFLPGTVVLEIFRHQIQLLPRMLTVDGAEHAWQSESKITLSERNPNGAKPK